MNIELIRPTGVRLLTGDKFCKENIDVVPKLQSKTVKANGTVSSDDGYAGLEAVVVDVPVPDGYIEPSGTVNITANGTHSVGGFAEAQVNVPIPDGYIQPSGTKTVTANGEHDVTEYAKVKVDVPIPGPILQEKTATENGEVTPDAGYDGLSKVTVDVPIPDGYIQPTGTAYITVNGTHDVTSYASVSVNVPTETVEEYDGTVVIE